MSLLELKPRPLTRDKQTFRDDRLFIVGCDDTYAPDQYFSFFELSRVHVLVVPTKDSTSNARAVLDRVLRIAIDEDDERWMVLDTDHFIRGRHLRSFRAALKSAQAKGVNVALSRPCFELWLLLHHADETEVAALVNADAVQLALRKKLGEYNKCKLKREHFSAECVARACMRAERLDLAVRGGAIPSQNTTRVYLLWKAILAKAQGALIPAELRNLV
jgi:hypothetical protein